MQIETTRFGRIEIAEESLLHFPRGLYGLENTCSFCLLQHGESRDFLWLQSAEEPALAMVVTEPFRLFSNYEIEIPNPTAELLQVTSTADVSVYVSITLVGNGRQLYANLLGPLVINHRTGLGAQEIQDSSRYTTRHLIAERATEGQEENITPQPIANDRSVRTPEREGFTCDLLPGSGTHRPLTVPV
jgi:flagellar assembly factor FliW